MNEAQVHGLWRRTDGSVVPTVAHQRSKRTVLYSGSGIGYAGDANGAQIEPLVTVQLKSLKFQFVSSLLFTIINLPTFSTTLTAQNLSGSQSN